MREIKYQAWSKSRNEMIPWERIHCIFNVPDCDEIEFFNKDVEIGWLSHVKLREWTGLVDKNNVEIYEGDIGYAIRTKDKKKMLIQFGMAHAYVDYFMRPFEVIGNIYENPELLEEQNKKL